MVGGRSHQPKSVNEDNHITFVVGTLSFNVRTVPCCATFADMHDDVIKWKHFPRHWPIVRGICRWPVNSFHKGQWRGAVTFSLICAWINGWVNNSEVGDLRRHRAPLWRHYNGKISYRILTIRYYNNFYDSARLTEWTKTCVKWLLLFTPFSLISTTLD